MLWNARTVLRQFASFYAVQFPLYVVLFFIRCGTPLITCAIYDVMCFCRYMQYVMSLFSDEKVDPHVVLAMSESALIRLGVATMGDRICMKQLCKEAVYCSGDSNGVDSVDRNSSGSSESSAEQVREERRLLFRPCNQSGANCVRSASAGRAGQKKKGSKRTWTGQLVCLADRQA